MVCEGRLRPLRPPCTVVRLVAAMAWSGHDALLQVGRGLSDAHLGSLRRFSVWVCVPAYLRAWCGFDKDCFFCHSHVSFRCGTLTVLQPIFFGWVLVERGCGPIACTPTGAPTAATTTYPPCTPTNHPPPHGSPLRTVAFRQKPSHLNILVSISMAVEKKFQKKKKKYFWQYLNC